MGPGGRSGLGAPRSGPLFHGITSRRGTAPRSREGTARVTRRFDATLPRMEARKVTRAGRGGELLNPHGSCTRVPPTSLRLGAVRRRRPEPPPTSRLSAQSRDMAAGTPGKTPMGPRSGAGSRRRPAGLGCVWGALHMAALCTHAADNHPHAPAGGLAHRPPAAGGREFPAALLTPLARRRHPQRTERVTVSKVTHPGGRRWARRQRQALGPKPSAPSRSSTGEHRPARSARLPSSRNEPSSARPRDPHDPARRNPRALPRARWDGVSQIWTEICRPGKIISWQSPGQSRDVSEPQSPGDWQGPGTPACSGGPAHRRAGGRSRPALCSPSVPVPRGRTWQQEAGRAPQLLLPEHPRLKCHFLR